jgi:hypothetical protein
MGTFPVVTQIGGPKRWQLSGQNIGNHEVFAFKLFTGEAGTVLRNVGALISDVTVYMLQDPFPPADRRGDPTGVTPSYNITLNAVDQFANPVRETIFGQFESNGV